MTSFVSGVPARSLTGQYVMPIVTMLEKPAQRSCGLCNGCRQHHGLASALQTASAFLYTQQLQRQTLSHTILMTTLVSYFARHEMRTRHSELRLSYASEQAQIVNYPGLGGRPGSIGIG